MVFLTMRSWRLGILCGVLARTTRTHATPGSSDDAGRSSTPVHTIEHIGELVRHWAEHCPEKVAYTFLAEDKRERRSVTYGELGERTRSLAARLQAQVRPGERVLLLYPPGLGFIEGLFSCMLAGMVAVPAYPPRTGSSQHNQRIEGIVEDCLPAAVLTTQSLLETRDMLVNAVPSLATLPFVPTTPITSDVHAWRPSAIGRDDLAFLQYTSGSTEAPKGVMVSHGALMENLTMIRVTMPQRGDSVLVGWLPVFHDMGLVGLINYTMFLGARCVLMAPEQFLRKPISWLEAVTQYGGTLTGAPNFAFDLCLRKSTPAQRAELDLSSVEVLFNGAEPVRAQTIETFQQTFAPCGLRPGAFTPCYGLAESTLIVTGVRAGTEPRIRSCDAEALETGQALADGTGAGCRIVSCGSAAGDGSIAIVDADTGRPCDPGHVGEVWVSGPHVASGYWNRPEESVRVFAAHIADDPRRWLRTGDLGFVLDDELYVVGRIKDLLIVRGRNIAPHDLERVAEEADPGFRRGCGAVFQLARPDAEGQIVCVQEFDPRSGSSPCAAMQTLREAVARECGVECGLWRLSKLTLRRRLQAERSGVGHVVRSSNAVSSLFWLRWT